MSTPPSLEVANFTYTGGWQTWEVPDETDTVLIETWGGASGSTVGGYVKGSVSVVPGQILYIAVAGGGQANNGNLGGGPAWPNSGEGGLGEGTALGGSPPIYGGASGGGYSAVRLGSQTGTVICVAGGAGGSAGYPTPYPGGPGGANTGGSPTSHEPGISTGFAYAKGGTQTAGGAGGEPATASTESTKGAAGASLRGGAGGNANIGTTTNGAPGGGGGGGGYFGGGGGCGGQDITNYYVSTAGAGGSNYVGGMLAGAQNVQGGGHTGTASLSISWYADAGPGTGGNPNTPTNLFPDSGTHTGTNNPFVGCVATNNFAGLLRIQYLICTDDLFSTNVQTIYDPPSGYSIDGDPNDPHYPHQLTSSFVFNGLPATEYFVRAFSENDSGFFSQGYAETSFFTNFPPDPPTLTAPVNNVTLTPYNAVTFTWTVNDEDDTPQQAAELQYAIDDGTFNWVTNEITDSTTSFTVPAGPTFSASTFYIWRVRTLDTGNLWSDWSDPFRFFISGTTAPPTPLTPVSGYGVPVDAPVQFTWRFNDPTPGDAQTRADIQYRAAGTDDQSWQQLTGDTTIPGATQGWLVPTGAFQTGIQWEWQVRTYDEDDNPSDWSISSFFYGIITPGSSAGNIPIVGNDYTGELGCGRNIAVLAAKGGQVFLGDLTPLAQIKWTRTRDDISTCDITINVNAQDPKSCELLSQIRTWQHEIVVFRELNGKLSRVWEGPITRIGYYPDSVQIEARDVMVWAYRRIMKQGYNDSYPNLNTVTARARQILINAFAQDDPNVLPFLTTFQFDDDAQESRIVDDWTTTAWEEVDDMAAKAGLDYVVVGRRIILFDTHRPIGRLPPMYDAHFSDPPTVTEYGMNLATLIGVSNGAGVFGSYGSDIDPYYGPIELLVNAYSDAAAASDDTLTPAAKLALIDSLNQQAQRSFTGRYPAPLLVHVPDNSTLRPDVPISLDYLVPGVWIPLRATKVCRPVMQWQKLDSMSVTESPDTGEQIQVVMSPAPGAGQDPDADDASTADDGGDGS